MCLEFNISTIPQMSCSCFPFIPPTSQTHSNQKIITVLKIIKLRKYKGKITFSVHMFWGNFFFFAVYFENFQFGPIKFQNISFQIGCQESEKKEEVGCWA